VEPRIALRPEGARGHRDRNHARRERVADALEPRPREGHYQGPPMDRSTRLQIVLGAALENTARRHKVWVWRPGRPLLSAFLDEIARRPSFAATVQTGNRALTSALIRRDRCPSDAGMRPCTWNDCVAGGSAAPIWK